MLRLLFVSGRSPRLRNCSSLFVGVLCVTCHAISSPNLSVSDKCSSVKRLPVSGILVAIMLSSRLLVTQWTPCDVQDLLSHFTTPNLIVESSCFHNILEHKPAAAIKSSPDSRAHFIGDYAGRVETPGAGRVPSRWTKSTGFASGGLGEVVRCNSGWARKNATASLLSTRLLVVGGWKRAGDARNGCLKHLFTVELKALQPHKLNLQG
ncbi:hypothetical protein B0H63DRAFT_76980 [Podospora didyma]|uniref:Uncharacterized protein n=1 Tax=Podospora didyma TaxID=330526 RepID=A0AAE0N357_9PEZI|nr:hypothetical protein B0H63DRAFT_76980 [Podospora didyma]